MNNSPERTSLNALLVFEAAARHASFTRAADELGISQPAVSHSVRLLETELGSVLFNRRNKGVFITQSGKYLMEQVAFGLNVIHQAVREVRTMSVEHQVTLAVSTATATWWLLPRIARFKKLYPKIELRVITTDRDLDLDRDRVDLAITLGAGNFENYQVWKFMDEEVFPVCSPGFLRLHGPIRDIKSLAKLPLMHLEERYKSRISWTHWLKTFGVTLKRENAMFRFNDYSIVLQAAMEGQGIAQGWKHLVEPLIAQGLLVRPLKESVTTDQPFFVVAPKATELRSDVLNLKNWLIAEAGKT
jgi:DNA-binding transcriptional LysR family regulator